MSAAKQRHPGWRQQEPGWWTREGVGGVIQERGGGWSAYAANDLWPSSLRYPSMAAAMHALERGRK